MHVADSPDEALAELKEFDLLLKILSMISGSFRSLLFTTGGKR